MKKIYIVTCGEYSDYCIEKVFSTEKAANKYVNTFETSWDYYRIEEYVIDAAVDYNNLAVSFRIENIDNKHCEVKGFLASALFVCGLRSNYKFEVRQMNRDEGLDINNFSIEITKMCNTRKMLHYKKNGEKILRDIYAQYLSLIEIEGFTHAQAIESVRNKLHSK